MRTTILCLLTLARLNAQTTVTGAIQNGGLSRDYRLYVPAAYTGSAAVPLVLNLHGYSSNNLEQEFYGNFHAIADTANFLVVQPNGTLDAQGYRFWNTFGGNSSVDDVAFLAALIDSLSASYNIDPNRIYSTGMSNGGFMSYALACELNNRIAAIASVTGSMIVPNLSACQPTRPVPVMEIHGTADNTVPYTGAVLSGFVPIPTLVAAWVNFNHCNPTPVLTPVPDTNPNDGCTAEHFRYSGGFNGSTVEHYKINGGGHTWPGAFFSIGVTNQDFNASQVIWRFFSQYRLDQLTDVKTPTPAGTTWSVAPNPVQDAVLLQSANDRPAERIRVFDALGSLRQTLRPTQAALRLETARWPAGVYVLVIEQDGQLETLRVVKEN